MAHPHDPIEPNIVPPGEAPAEPADQWAQHARALGYASAAPLIADLRVAYDDGRIARASGRPCRQVAFMGDHAQAWVDGWWGWKKPVA